MIGIFTAISMKEPNDYQSSPSVLKLTSVDNTFDQSLVLVLFDAEAALSPGNRKRVINQPTRNQQLPDILLMDVMAANVSGIEGCIRVQHTSLFDALPQISTPNPSNL